MVRLRRASTLVTPWLATLAVLLTSTGCRSRTEKEAAFLRNGKEYRNKRDFARALLQFKNAAAAMPRDAEPLYQMGMTYLSMRDVRDAAAYLRKATELNPNHADAQLNLSRLLADYGDKDLVSDAHARIQQFLKNQPDNVEAADTLAVTEFKLGKPEEAIKGLEAVLSRSSGHLRSSVELARMKEALKDLAGAEDVLKQAVASAPRSWEAILLLGDFYLRNNRLVDAENEARRALEIDQKNPPALALLGTIQDRRGARDEAESTVKPLSVGANRQLKPIYGTLLLQHGKTDEAIREFKRLAAEDPSDRDARSRLVAAYVATNRSDQAERVLLEAVQRNGKDADALLQLSSLYLLKGRTKDAESDLTLLLHLKANLPAAHYQMAHVYERQRRDALHRQELGETIRLDPKFLAARIELARALVSSNNALAALATLDEAPEAQKSAVEWRVARNRALLANHNYDELATALSETPANGNADLTMQDARLHFLERDYAGARALIAGVLRENPDDMRASNAFAETWLAEGDQAKAVQTVRDFARKHADSPVAQQWLASWLVRSGNRPEAKSILTSLLGKDPMFAPAALLSAKLDFEDKKYDAVCHTMQGILTADPSNVEARMRLADAEHMSGHESAAIEQYRTVLKYDGSNWMVLNNLAYMLVNTNTDEALKYAQTALEHEPDNPIVLDTAGWVFLHKNMYAEAVKELERAAQKRNTAVSKYHLALAYMKNGQRRKGQEMLQAALAMEPDLAKTQQQDWALWGELGK